MNKIIIITILIFLTFLTFGQKQLIGISGGLIYSNVNINPELFKEKTIKQEWTVNVNYERFLSEKISIETGLQYERKGFVDNFIVTDEFGTEIMNEELPFLYEYASIPISLKYTVGNRLKSFGQIGVIPSYFIKGEIEYPEIMKPAIPDPPLNEKVNRFDLGIFVGMGISYQIIERVEVNVNGLFNHSFVSMTNEQFYKDYEMYNYFYNINFGLKYYLKNE